MPVSREDLVNEVWRLLSEAAESDLGELANAAGDLVSSGTAAVEDYLRQAAEACALTCCPIPAVASGMDTSAGKRAYRLGDYNATFEATGAVGYRLWVCTDIYSASRIRPTMLSVLQADFPDYAGTQGSPVKWYPAGRSLIGLYPTPDAEYSVILHGLAVPPALDEDDAAPYMSDADARMLLPRGAAALLARTRRDDEVLAAKAVVWQGEFDQMRRQMRAGVDALHLVHLAEIGAALDPAAVAAAAGAK